MTRFFKLLIAGILAAKKLIVAGVIALQAVGLLWMARLNRSTF